MIYAVKKPIQEYDVVLNGERCGLYSIYESEPDLLAAALIFTPVGYDYEHDKPEEKRTAQFGIKTEESLRQTLMSEVSGDLVKTLLESLTPMEFYERMKYEDTSHLPLVREYYDGKSSTLSVMMGARAAVWAKNYRGRLQSSGAGKVISAAFSGMKVPQDLINQERLLREELGYA